LAMKRGILYVDFAPVPGGSIISLYSLVRGLDGSKYEPVVVLARGNSFLPRFRELGVEVIALPVRQGYREQFPSPLEKVRRSGLRGFFRRRKGLRALWRGAGLGLRLALHIVPVALRLWGIIRARGIRLVHLNDAVPVSRAGIIAARMSGRPCVCHVRAWASLEGIDRFLSGLVDQFIFVSRAVAEAQKAQGLRVRRGEVIYNWVEPAEFAPREGKKVRRELGISPQARVIGMVGRLVRWKGHEVLLRSLAGLASRFSDLVCLIVGAPDVSQPEYGDELAALARSLGLRSRVIFTGHREDIADVMAALDVLVHPSVRPEPFGRSVIEAMASALPVVASDIGAIPEIVEDGVTGILVPPGDPRALEEALDSLLVEPGLARRMGEAGRRRVKALFAARPNIQRVERIYQALLCPWGMTSSQESEE